MSKKNEDVFDQYLSIVDLRKHEEWDQAWQDQDNTKMEKILYEMGADIDYGYDFKVCYHRPRTSKETVEDLRVSFRERRDRKWVSEMMELEDIIRVTEDRSLRQDMLQMSKRLDGGREHSISEEVWNEG